MFIDQVILELEAGNGGAGAVSFHREKYVPSGPPDGGNGGNGGNIILVGSNRYNTLNKFKTKKKYKAESGQPGSRNNCTGKSGSDLIIYIPCGTVVFNKDNEIIADILNEGERFTAATGGRGGRGNAGFATSTRRSPKISERGNPGEKISIKLELKLIADAGIIGLPNAGKSTFIRRVSKARPKVADYPFTTLEPVLGVSDLSDYRSIVFADIPGLIEGASLGTGLGDKFLKHTERTKILIHLIDSTSDDVLSDYYSIRKELKNYSGILAKKNEIAVLSKIDLIDKKKLDELKKIFCDNGIEINFISSATGDGINILLEKIYSGIQDIENIRFQKKKTYKFEKPFWIEKKDGVYYLKGKEIENLIEKYDLNNIDNARYFYEILRQQQWIEEMINSGIKPGTEVVINDRVFIFQPENNI